MRRWEELRPELDERGVAIVTLCADTPEQIRKGRGKHGLKATMLSDRDLAVTRAYELENRAPMVRPPGLEGLRCVFIRAPQLEDLGTGVEVLARVDDRPVLVREGNVWAATFHPELTPDPRVHALLLSEARA